MEKLGNDDKIDRLLQMKLLKLSLLQMSKPLVGGNDYEFVKRDVSFPKYC